MIGSYGNVYKERFCFSLKVIIIIIIIIHYSFSHQRKLMVFHWRLSDSKSPQVFRTLLSILAVFNNAVVWMVSTRLPTSKSYDFISRFSKHRCYIILVLFKQR